jgi:hypothetical protein
MLAKACIRLLHAQSTKMSIPIAIYCYPTLNLLIEQVKSNLIRQRELDLLLPAAGPGASDVLQLLRPAVASRVQPVLATASAPISSLQYAKIAVKEPLPISTASATSRAKSMPGETGPVDKLLHISCTVGAGGEVCCFFGLDRRVRKLIACRAGVVLGAQYRGPLTWRAFALGNALQEPLSVANLE